MTEKRPQSTRMARRRAHTRERILDTAAALFEAAGVKNGRVEDLAEAADVSVGAIYNHFGDKQGIVLALAERSIREFGEALDRALAPQTIEPIERLMSVADLYAQYCLEHRSSFQFVIFNGPDASTGSASDREALAKAERQLLERFQGAIQEAIDAGQIDAQFDACVTARFLWGAWNGVFAQILRTDELALNEDEVLAALDVGRRLVNEGLTAPAYRDADGRSRSHPMNTLRG